MTSLAAASIRRTLAPANGPGSPFPGPCGRGHRSSPAKGPAAPRIRVLSHQSDTPHSAPPKSMTTMSFFSSFLSEAFPWGRAPRNPEATMVGKRKLRLPGASFGFPKSSPASSHSPPALPGAGHPGNYRKRSGWPCGSSRSLRVLSGPAGGNRFRKGDQGNPGQKAFQFLITSQLRAGASKPRRFTPMERRTLGDPPRSSSCISGRLPAAPRSWPVLHTSSQKGRPAPALRR